MRQSDLGQGQRLAVEDGGEGRRYRRTKRLGGMAGPLGVRDHLPHPGFRSGGLDLQVEGHLLEGSGWAAEVVFVGHAESCPNINIGLLDGHFVYRRKLRQLRQQSKSGAGQQVLERRWGSIFASALRRLVGLDMEPADASDHMHVLVDVRQRSLSEDWHPCSVVTRGGISLRNSVPNVRPCRSGAVC